MPPVIIAVGSQNPDKITATKKVAERLLCTDNFDEQFDLVYEVIGCDVNSGVRAQPISTDEAMRGASNRANEALRKVPGANIGVGIEGGMHLVDGIWFNQAWVYVTQYINSETKCSFAGSNAVPIPNVLMDKILSGTEISFAVDEILETEGMKNRGGWHGVYSRERITLSASIEDAIMLAFVGLEMNERFGTLSSF